MQVRHWRCSLVARCTHFITYRHRHLTQRGQHKDEAPPQLITGDVTFLFFFYFNLFTFSFLQHLSSFLFHVPWAERVVVSEQPMNQYTTYYTLPVPNSTSPRSHRYPALHRIRSSGHDLDIFGRTVCRCSIPKQMSKFLLHFIVFCPFPPPTRSL